MESDDQMDQADETLMADINLEDRIRNMNLVTKVIIRPSSRVIPTINEGILAKLYHSLDIPEKEFARKSEWRLNTLHMRGVHDMSTQDVLEYFNEYEPNLIEWVNDISCNIVFENHQAAANALLSLTSALVVPKSQTTQNLPNDIDIIDTASLNISVPPVRWRLGKQHLKAETLLLRFANNGDRKMLGARKHSQYYLKYGFPGQENAKINTNWNKYHKRIGNKDFNNEDDENEDNDDMQSASFTMTMRADEEETKMRMINRLTADDYNIDNSEHINISSWDKSSRESNERPSVWERLDVKGVRDNQFSNPKSIVDKRTVRYSNSGLKVFSRLGRSFKHKMPAKKSPKSYFHRLSPFVKL